MAPGLVQKILSRLNCAPKIDVFSKSVAELPFRLVPVVRVAESLILARNSCAGPWCARAWREHVGMLTVWIRVTVCNYPQSEDTHQLFLLLFLRVQLSVILSFLRFLEYSSLIR